MSRNPLGQFKGRTAGNKEGVMKKLLTAATMLFYCGYYYGGCYYGSWGYPMYGGWCGWW
jgi:hypothetical protein